MTAKPRIRKANAADFFEGSASSVGDLGSSFVDFLLEKLGEYQAQEAVAPCSDLRERIALVQEMLESFLPREPLVELTNEVSPFAASPGRLLQ